MKTNKILEWFIVDKNGNFARSAPNRKAARMYKNVENVMTKQLAPFRIAKSVVTK